MQDAKTLHDFIQTILTHADGFGQSSMSDDAFHLIARKFGVLGLDHHHPTSPVVLPAYPRATDLLREACRSPLWIPEAVETPEHIEVIQAAHYIRSTNRATVQLSDVMLWDDAVESLEGAGIFCRPPDLQLTDAGKFMGEFLSHLAFELVAPRLCDYEVIE
jgi:hypothetical protein